jgi:hypothetical protein
VRPFLLDRIPVTNGDFRRSSSSIRRGNAGACQVYWLTQATFITGKDLSSRAPLWFSVSPLRASVSLQHAPIVKTKKGDSRNGTNGSSPHQRTSACGMLATRRNGSRAF